MVWKEDIQAYRRFCAFHQDKLPLFFQEAWLKAVITTGSYRCWVAIENEKEVAVFVGHFRSKYGITAQLMPRLTPYLGFWSPELENTEKTTKLIASLLPLLPRVFYTSICLFHQVFDNTPWETSGMQQRSRCTYIISSHMQHEYKNHYSTRLNNHIKKASKYLRIVQQQDTAVLAELTENSFKQQSLQLPYSKQLLKQIFNCKEAGAVIRVATDADGNAHAAVMTVEDATTVYNLVSGRNADAVRGAMAMLLDSAINDAMARGKAFDFEGSSIKSIATFFASFGGKFTPFQHIYGARYNWVNRLIELTGKYKV